MKLNWLMRFSVLNRTFMFCICSYYCSKLPNVKVRTKQKDVLKYAAADVSLGNKKVQVALVKVVFVPHNGRRRYRIRTDTTQLCFKLPKKVRRLAIKSALSSKVIDNEIIVLDQLDVECYRRRKNSLAILNNLKVDRKALVVTASYDDNVASICS